MSNRLDNTQRKFLIGMAVTAAVLILSAAIHFALT